MLLKMWRMSSPSVTGMSSMDSSEDSVSGCPSVWRLGLDSLLLRREAEKMAVKNSEVRGSMQSSTITASQILLIRFIIDYRLSHPWSQDYHPASSLPLIVTTIALSPGLSHRHNHYKGCMDNPDHMKLKIRTLEASNKRLRKHLREARSPHSPTSCMLTSSRSLNHLNESQNASDSSMSINGYLQKGMDYIVERYQHDIRSLIDLAESRTRIEDVFPFISESRQLMEELAKRIHAAKRVKTTPRRVPLQEGLQSLVDEYSKIKVENENKIKVILGLEQVIQRLHFQHHFDQINMKVVREMSQILAGEIHRIVQLKPRNKFKATVHVVRFSLRLLKSQKTTKQATTDTNLQMVESPGLHRQLFKSYANHFEYSLNETSLRRLLTKDPAKCLNRLLNLEVFNKKPNCRMPSLKLNCLDRLGRYPELYEKTMTRIRTLEKQIQSYEMNHKQQSHHSREHLMVSRKKSPRVFGTKPSRKTLKTR